MWVLTYLRLQAGKSIVWPGPESTEAKFLSAFLCDTFSATSSKYLGPFTSPIRLDIFLFTFQAIFPGFFRNSTLKRVMMLFSCTRCINTLHLSYETLHSRLFNILFYLMRTCLLSAKGGRQRRFFKKLKKKYLFLMLLYIPKCQCPLKFQFLEITS